MYEHVADTRTWMAVYLSQMAPGVFLFRAQGKRRSPGRAVIVVLVRVKLWVQGGMIYDPGSESSGF